jgi:6-phosphogluconolactonase
VSQVDPIYVNFGLSEAEQSRLRKDADAGKLVLPVESAAAHEHRLTLTLGKIVEAGFLALHIEGPDKKQVLDRVLAGEKLPIGTAIAASPRPVEIFWAE